LSGEPEQAIRDAGQGRHDDDWTPRVTSLALCFGLPFGAHNRNEPLDGVAIRHRRPAELHHDHT
jgi:hypothetical protein